MSTRYNTGNPIESTDVRDMSDNAKNFDEFVNSASDEFTDRLGIERKTIHGMNSEFDSQILNMGFTRVGTFAVGATLTNPRQTLLWDIADGGDGQEYGWSGTFSKIVPPGSTPNTTGGIAVGAWMSRFDPELKGQVREALRRSYAEAGYNLVDGSFEAGGTLVNANDVLLQERTGKAFSGPAGTVAAGTNPASGGFVDKSGELLRHELATSNGATKVRTSDGRTVEQRLAALPNEVDAAGTAAGLVSAHNQDAAAHPQLRAFITSEADRAELAAEAASATGRIYETSAAGQADAVLVAGDYFWVVSAADSEVLELWRKGATTATDTGKRTISTNGVNTLLGPIRLKNQYPQPSFADGIIPELRAGKGVLTAISNEYLNKRGAINGVSITDMSSTTPRVLVTLPEGSAGKYVIMSCYAYITNGGLPPLGSSAYITTDKSLIYTGLTGQRIEIEHGVFLLQAWGEIPEEATALAIGANLRENTTARLVTGVTYAIADAPILHEVFEYDNLRPPVLLTDLVNQVTQQVYGNLMTFGDFMGGEPERRSGSAVVTLTQPEITARGYRRGIQWRSVNEYVRYSGSVSIANKHAFGCFLVHSDNPANLNLNADIYLEQDGGALTNISSVAVGAINLSAKTKVVWKTGVLADRDATKVLLGSASTPVDTTRFATGFFLLLADSAFDVPSVLNNYFLADKARQQSVRAVERLVDYSKQVMPPRLVLSGEGVAANSYVEGWQGNKVVRREFTPFPTTSLLRSNVFNFRGDYIDEVLVKSHGDDAAPYRALGTTIGANHGFFMGEAIAASHGKTDADVGAVYSSDGVEYVIVSIISADRLYLTQRFGNGPVRTGTFDHVSGGISTGSFTVSSAAKSISWFPPITNRRIRCFVDGKEVIETTGTFGFADRAVIVESYDVLDKTELVNWLIANGSAGVLDPQGDPSFTVSISYEFDREANCTIYTDFLALKSMPLQDIMFLQAERGQLTHYYVPKALPFSHEGFNFNYAMIEPSNKTIVNNLSSVNFTPARCEPAGILCDRVIGFNGSASAFAMGYLPVGTTGIAERRTQAANRVIEIRGDTGKLYPRAVDKGNVTLSPGEYFSTIGYRNVFAQTPERTSAYPVRTRGADYFYCDWHDVVKFDRVELPTDYAGREFEVVESRNATLYNGGLTGSIAVDVDCADGYAYLILKIR